MITTDYFPIGGILPFGGINVNPKLWLPCEGQQLNINEYPELFDKIGYIYGGSDDYFNAPDYRGFFMRGVSGSSNNDPEAARRTPINKKAIKGSLIDSVGLKQAFSTKSPDTPFLGQAPNLPSGNYSISGETKTEAASDNGDYKGDTCDSGGDLETRPINVYVNYYIKANNQ